MAHNMMRFVLLEFISFNHGYQSVKYQRKQLELLLVLIHENTLGSSRGLANFQVRTSVSRNWRKIDFTDGHRLRRKQEEEKTLKSELGFLIMFHQGSKRVLEIIS